MYIVHLLENFQEEYNDDYRTGLGSVLQNACGETNKIIILRSARRLFYILVRQQRQLSSEHYYYILLYITTKFRFGPIF